MVSSDEQCGWQVLGESVQPGHVEVIGDRLLAGDGHAPGKVTGRT